jgi:FKBP12-rapamycin complex-associated protein
LPHDLFCAILQAYGRELSEAYEWLSKYRLSRKEAELHQAWDLYYHVFKRINKQLHSLTTLELQYVAPALVRRVVAGFRDGCCVV